MNPEALSRIRHLLAYLESNKHRLVMDADTHVSDLNALSEPFRRRYEANKNYYHGRPISAEDLLAEMRMAEVDMALTWQNPAATAYCGDPVKNFDALIAANRYVCEAALQQPERFIPGGWVDPKACGIECALKMVEMLVAGYGCLFVKLNAAQNGYCIDSDSVLRVVDSIVELGAIPAFHFGADTPFTPAEGLERVAARHPDHPLLAIHMGGGGAGYVEGEELCQKARELGLRRPNIRFALSAKRDTHMESDLITYQLAGEPFCRNLFCASDAPYGRLTWNFGGFRAMFRSLLDGANHPDARLHARPNLFTKEAVQGYLGGSFATFVLAGYTHLLEVQGGS